MSFGSRLAAFAAAVGADVKALFSSKVDKVEGKGLSSNDYTTADKDALAKVVADLESAQSTLVNLQDQIDAMKGS